MGFEVRELAASLPFLDFFSPFPFLSPFTFFFPFPSAGRGAVDSGPVVQ